MCGEGRFKKTVNSLNSWALMSDQGWAGRSVTSPPTMRPVARRQEPARRSRWIAAACGAVLLHIVSLAMIIALPDRTNTKDAEQAPQVMLLLAEPEAPAAAPPEMPLDTPEPARAAPIPPVAAEAVMEPNSPLPPASPPVADPAEAPPPASPPPVASEPVMEAGSPPLAASPPSPVLSEPPAVAAAHSAPQAGSAKPRAAARSPSIAQKTLPSPAVSPAERGAAGQVASDGLEPYRNNLASHVRAFQKYPALARARRQEGLVVVHVKVERDGHILSMAVEQGSGSALLDQEALATLKRAEPMPAVPSVVPGAVVDLVFPLRFALE